MYNITCYNIKKLDGIQRPDSHLNTLRYAVILNLKAIINHLIEKKTLKRAYFKL